jgi:hypothetical protein
MRRRTATGAGATLMALALVAPAAGEETFVGTVAVPQGGATPVSVALTLTVREHTSDERANQLAQMLHDRGHQAVAAELAKDDVGQLRLGDDSVFRVTLVRPEPTGNGRILRVVTDRPMQGVAKTSGAPPPAGTVGYLQLTLDAANTGEGQLYPAVTAKFDAEGFVAPDNVGGVSWQVSGVKPKP